MGQIMYYWQWPPKVNMQNIYDNYRSGTVSLFDAPLIQVDADGTYWPAAIPC
jgi:hypothetical protein